MPQRQLAHFLKILEVFRIGEGIAALDEIDPQFVEPLRDEQLVLQREVNAFPLTAVAKGSVVDLDAGLRHAGHLLGRIAKDTISPANDSWRCSVGDADARGSLVR